MKALVKDLIFAVAVDTALFNELLNILGPTAPSCCGCSAEWQAAVQLIRKRLNLCPECGSEEIRKEME